MQPADRRAQNPRPSPDPACVARGAPNGLLAGTILAAVAFAGGRPAAAHELALAQGTIAVRAAAPGQVSPACSQLVVEARDGLDDHLIARTDPALAPDGSCRYAISVPAQSAVWLRLRPALVADARAGVQRRDAGGGAVGAQRDDRRVSSRAVQLRWTVIAPSTYFFQPNETKTVPLSY